MHRILKCRVNRGVTVNPLEGGPIAAIIYKTSLL